jgi:hypothetical protein
MIVEFIQDFTGRSYRSTLDWYITTGLLSSAVEGTDLGICLHHLTNSRTAKGMSVHMGAVLCTRKGKHGRKFTSTGFHSGNF